jgi:photosystem II stability/assembly factor-like uncharacterized protein
VNDSESGLLVATQNGLSIFHRLDNRWHESRRILSERDVTGVVAREGVILAGTSAGVFRSDDEGQTWREANAGLQSLHVRWLAYHPDASDLEFVGTEPAGICVSHDGAANWRGCPEVAALRDHHRWFLPYSPEAGCVRSFAFSGQRAYAAVEVGGVLRSDDRGETWRLAGGSTGEPTFDLPPAPFVFADAHWVEAHPISPELVYAATAEGLYRSQDGGDTWSVSHAGSYCRAVWVDPLDPEHIILSPADSVAHKNSRIERSRDGGLTWSLSSDGLDLPWPDRMVERFAFVTDQLLAITNDGRLYGTSPSSMVWERLLSDLRGIQAVAPYVVD